MSETIHRCPTCGSAVRVAGGEDEPGGTRHYEPDTTERDELVAALLLLAGSTHWVGYNGRLVCGYCGSQRDHAPDCRWLRAARVLARLKEADRG